jgi:hypothetical protein
MSRNLSRPFQIRAESVDAQRRALTATVATEAPVEIYDWQSGRIVREVLLMSGVEVSPHVPLLCDHDRSIASMVGNVEDIRVEGDTLVASFRFANGAPQADAAWALYSQRHGRQVSVGYRVLASEEIPPGRTQNVGGRTFTAPQDAPLRVTTRWRLYEVSLVPIGADAAAMTRSAIVPHSHERTTKMSSVFDVLGSNVRSMRFPQFLAAGMKRRNQQVPENDADVCRAALSTVEGNGKVYCLPDQSNDGGPIDTNIRRVHTGLSCLVAGANQFGGCSASSCLLPSLPNDPKEFFDFMERSRGFQYGLSQVVVIVRTVKV